MYGENGDDKVPPCSEGEGLNPLGVFRGVLCVAGGAVSVDCGSKTLAVDAIS